MNPINWNENFKIRIANSSKEFQKHEVIKLLVMMKLIEKHKLDKNWIRIYSEFPVDDNLIPDIYFEDIKSKSIICYEIQKNMGDEYIKRKTKQYNELNIAFFNTVDLIIIPIKNAPNDLNELNNYLDQYII